MEDKTHTHNEKEIHTTESGSGIHPDSYIEKAVKAAVADERERCAALCHKLGEPELAARIRSGG